MISFKLDFLDYSFSPRERFCNSLGLTILAVSGVIAFAAYGLGYLFSGKPWQLVSPWLHLTCIAVGIVLVWKGSGKAIRQAVRSIDTCLAEQWSYRALRWVLAKVFSIVGFVITVIFFAWIRQSPPGSGNITDQRDRTADDIWDGHPKHYYDNDPPDPFS